MQSRETSNTVLSSPDSRDYHVADYLHDLLEPIPDEMQVWQPPTIESQKAGNCTVQAIMNIIECLVYQRYGVHLEHSIGYTYGTPFSVSDLPGIEPRDGFKSVLHEGVMLREAWECDDENPVCREKRQALPDKIHKLAKKYIRAYVRLNSKEEMQRYMMEYGLPVLAVAPMRSFSFGSGYHAVAVYGWVTKETAQREYVYMEDRDLRYTNSWGSWNSKGLVGSNMLSEMWGVIPTEEEIDMRGTEHLHPELQKICGEFLRICLDNGLNVKITDTLRSKEEQDALYAQGRTAPGDIVTTVKYPNSAHNWGVAFDICRNVKGREYDDSDNFFAKCGLIGESLGLTWGGLWESFQDKPHFELKKFMPNSSTKWLRETYGDPDNFKKTWREDMITAEQLAELLPEAFVLMGQKPASEWAKPALAWAKDNGLMVGDATGNQMPCKPLTREEAAQILYNALKNII
jgi:peptidoglycan L-alanyl-D-glutamate endopeptidase CwlK